MKKHDQIRFVASVAFLSLAIAVPIGETASLADDLGTISSGNWNNASIWTSTPIPGSADTVFIGSTYPSGAATTATVNLTQDQSAAAVIVGYDSGTLGTLDLGNSELTIAGSLYIGFSPGATGIVQRGSGGFTGNGLTVNNGNSFTFGAPDAVDSVGLYNGSALTTVAVGNVTDSAAVYSGSTLTLGADMALTGGFDVTDNGSTLDMGGRAVNTNALWLGWYGGSPTVLNRGPLTANDLYVGNRTFSLIATDAVSNLHLSNGTGVLVATNALNSVDLSSASALDLNGHNLSVGGLYGTATEQVVNNAAGTTSVLIVGTNDAYSSFDAVVKDGSASAVLAVSKVGAGILTLSGANTYTGLTTVEGGKLVLQAGAKTPVLSNAGVDVKFGKLVLDYTDSGTSPTAVDTAMKASYAGGAWAGGQFQSSTATTANTLGWKADTVNKLITVEYTLYGDANVDGSVNLSDLGFLGDNYGLTTGATWAMGDFNYDGRVNLSDLGFLGDQYGGHVAGFVTAGPVGRAAPEPGTLVLLLGGAMCLLVFAWRHTQAHKEAHKGSGVFSTRPVSG